MFEIEVGIMCVQVHEGEYFNARNIARIHPRTVHPSEIHSILFKVSWVSFWGVSQRRQAEKEEIKYFLAFVF